MRKIKLLGIVLLSIVAQSAYCKDKAIYPYKNPNLSIETRVDDLIGRMTIEEKVYQLCAIYLSEGDEIYKQTKEYSIDKVRKEVLKGFGSVSNPTREMSGRKSAQTNNAIQKIALEQSRLAIPLLINEEALHGIVGFGACSYPQPIGLASSWDLDMMTKIGDAIGREVNSRGVTQVLSPTLDIGRDPRHGRFAETYGEDPMMVSLFAGEFIKGVQKHNVAAAPKHLVANFVGEAGREGTNIELSERALRSVHLKPYEYAVKSCGVLGVMAAYNAINGVPCHSNSWLLNKVLRDEWGFKGVVVSDWSAIPHLYNHHRVAESHIDAAVSALRAGVDIDLPRGQGFVKLADAVKQGKIKESELDVNVKRILWLKFHLGLFDNPFVDPDLAQEMQGHPHHRALALEAAQKGMVLLKNDGTLPVKKEVKKIAVIGPNANVVQLGGYSSSGVKAKTPLQGLKDEFGDAIEFTYAKGTDIINTSTDGFHEAISAAKQADMTIMFMGSGYGAGGETEDRVELNLMGVQQELILKIAETGRPVVVVLVCDRPVIVRQWIDKVSSLVMMWYAGEQGGPAIAQVIKGEYNPGGKLPCTFPLYTGQLPLYYSFYHYGRESRTAEIVEQKRNTYRYDPQYPFGFGLSYTEFEYSDIEVKNDNSLTPNISVRVKNRGAVAGDEVVQLYLLPKVSRMSRPNRELKAFKRITLAPGEEKTVDFDLNSKDFSMYNESSMPEIALGGYEVLVGTNSQSGLKADLTAK